jgi:hypothetical protein
MVDIYRVCLIFHFTQKNFRFCPIILQNENKHHAKFLAKRYPFSILDFGLKRQKKKLKSAHSPHEKFDILDETQHTHKNLDILYLIISK